MPPPGVLQSRTFALSPPDRTRRRLGVGELVELACTSGPVQWEIVSGGGELSAAAGRSVQFRAPGEAAGVTIRAGSGSITFQVVEPSDLVFRRASRLRHTQGRPDCGFQAQVYLLPADVSFHAVEIREWNSAATLSGFYDSPEWRGIRHRQAPGPSRWLPIGQPLDGGGSSGDGWKDIIYSGDPGGLVRPGAMTFSSAWEYRCLGVSKRFATVIQTHTIDSSGRCTSTKQGESAACELDAMTSSY